MIRWGGRRVSGADRERENRERERRRERRRLMEMGWPLRKGAKKGGGVWTRNGRRICSWVGGKGNLPVYKVGVDGGGGKMRVMNNRRLITRRDVVREVRDSPQIYHAVHASSQQVPARRVESLALLVGARPTKLGGVWTY